MRSKGGELQRARERIGNLVKRLAQEADDADSFEALLVEVVDVAIGKGWAPELAEAGGPSQAPAALADELGRLRRLIGDEAFDELVLELVATAGETWEQLNAPARGEEE